MENYRTNEGRILGVVLDVSIRPGPTGTRIIDTVKKQLIDFLRETMDGEDLFYLYHRDIIEPTMTIGSMVGNVGNYETEGWKMDLTNALLQTYFVVAIEDEDYEKAILLVTDRLSDSQSMEKIFKLEDKDEIGCKYLLVGIGDHCQSFNDYKNRSDVTCLHVDDPKDLKNALLRRSS